MLSKKDIDILKMLESNALLTPEDIGNMLGLDADYVRNKIKEFKEQGVILAYKTIIDWEKTGEDKVYAFIDVKVVPERDYGFDSIAKKIYNFDEVHSVYLMSGTYDLAVVVEGKSMKDVAYFVAEKLATINQVQSTVTHFVLKKYKIDGKILLPPQDKRSTISP